MNNNIEPQKNKSDVKKTNQVSFLDFIATKNFQNHLLSILTKHHLQSQYDKFLGMFKKLAMKEITSYSLTEYIEEDIGIGSPITSDLLVDFVLELYPDYEDELDEEAEKFYDKRDEFQKQFSIDRAVSMAKEENGLTLNDKTEKIFATIVMNMLLGSANDMVVLDTLTKAEKFDGIGLSEDVAQKVIKNLNKQREVVEMYDVNVYPLVLKFAKEKGIEIEGLTQQEERQKTAVQSSNMPVQQSEIAPKPNIQSSESLSSVLDQISSDLGYGNDNEKPDNTKPKK